MGASEMRYRTKAGAERLAWRQGFGEERRKLAVEEGACSEKLMKPVMMEEARATGEEQ